MKDQFKVDLKSIIQDGWVSNFIPKKPKNSNLKKFFGHIVRNQK